MFLQDVINLFVNEKLNTNSTVILVGSSLKELNKKSTNFKSDIDLLVIQNKNYPSGISFFMGIKFDIISWEPKKSLEIILKSVLGKNKVLNSLQNYKIIKDDLKIAKKITTLSHNLYDLILNDRFISYKKLSTLTNNIHSSLDNVNENDSFASNVSKFHLLNSILTFLIEVHYPFQAYGKFMGEILNKKLDFNNLFFQKDFVNIEKKIIQILNHKYSLDFFEKERREIITLEVTDTLIEKLKNNQEIIFYFGFDELADKKSILFIKKENIRNFDFFNINPVDVTLVNLTLGLKKEDQETFIKFLNKISFFSLKLNLELRIQLSLHILDYYLNFIDSESIIKTIKANILIELIKKNSSNKLNIKSILLKIKNIQLKERQTSSSHLGITSDFLLELKIFDKKIIENASKDDQENIFKTNFFRLIRAMRLSVYDIIQYG